jgi:NAD-dependent SIR2 family protein deacetylase
MAHGSPRYVVCWNCEKYSLISRFSSNPNCPTCNNKTETGNKQDIQIKNKVSWILGEWLEPQFDKWITFKQLKERFKK